MQITITQTEIETAIRNHVLALIAVRENMRVDIDLKATRGTEGFTAVIDITPEDGPKGGKPEEVSKPEVKAATKAEKTETKAEAPKAEVKVEEPVVEVVETEPEAEPVADEPVAEEATATKPLRAVFGKKAEPVKEPEVQAAEGQDNVPFDADPKPAVKKIFGGLSKPVNAKPEAA